MTVTRLGAGNGFDGFTFSDNGNGNSTYEYRFRLKATQGPNVERAPEIRTCLGVNLGSICPDDANAVCVGVGGSPTERRDGATVWWEWSATVKYAVQPANGEDQAQGPQSSSDPTARPTKINVSFERFRKPETKDTANKLIENSAHDAVPRERDAGRVSVTLEKYYATWDFRRCRDARIYGLRAYQLSRNENDFTVSRAPWAFFTISSGRGRMESIEPSEVYEKGATYALVRFKIIEDTDDWKDIFFDQGFYYLRSNFGVTRRVLFSDDFGGIASTPQLLNGAGAPLRGTGLDPQNLSFQHYPLRDWNVLGIP